MKEFFQEHEGRIPSGTAAYVKMLALLEKHPEANHKKKDGVQAFLIKRQGSSYQTRLITDQGNEVLFSWRTCLSGKSKTVKANLVSAMRLAVKPQVDAFRRSGPCALCGAHVPLKDVHVDHRKSFRKLSDTFLGSRAHPTTFDEAFLGGSTFKDKDDSFKQDWIEFHRMFAELQITHAKCNLSKGAR